MCPNGPNIISDDEARKAEREGKQVMRYPKDNNIEGYHEIICDFPGSDRKYPGLENPLTNNPPLLYLPCCYKTSHKDRENSIYKQYFYNEKRTEEVTEQQNLIKTNKFLDLDVTGEVPDGINNFFKLFNLDKTKFIRKGVCKSKSSFLECVMEGLDIDDLENYETEDERLKYLSNYRKELSNNINAAVCKQEMYNYEIDEIKRMISDDNVYMDPKLFISLLENVFKCNIFIFNRIDNESRLILPNHVQSYYKFKNEYNSIFIYEHMGSPSDY